MLNSSPAIVLLHGAFHTPAHYAEFTSILRSKGYEVHVPRLLTMNGVRPPNADLYSGSDYIRSYVESLVEAGREVVMLMHSYGGVVGTHALVGLGAETRKQQGRQGGVVLLIYLSAFAVTENNSMMSVVRRFGHEDLIPLAFDIAEDYSTASRDPKKLIIGPGRSDEETDAYVAAMQRWNGKAMYQNAERCAWREIPVAYIYATEDMNVPMDYQKWFVEKMREEGREVETVEVETGHCPTFTKFEETAKIVDGLVKKL
ncbi:Alpha/beta hydrolase fold-1 [Aspergillus pseudonomiae]|uniref:Alpha/beta hydrolase fold-1 n=1 Tax=Aspergillus pseudonomiae TaxID=1506151 RepID=A0A5N7DCE7_9EURO|nr:Alpha/beta hydrolase fold-1 [Aspergillus pseudonomiae]KAB8255284.1 Alpha/beta hydrolase fold-1 [Aspergillus pseudonomiae]KAE8404140.1 Alpha/beta hydrolase fold-1 [Aspergillus pseudonomiae]